MNADGSSASGSSDNSFPKPYLEFYDSPFGPAIMSSIKGVGYERPTMVQSQAWPIAMAGEDVISITKTGNGKTCGFLMPCFHKFLQMDKQDFMVKKAPSGLASSFSGRGGEEESADEAALAVGATAHPAAPPPSP